MRIILFLCLLSPLFAFAQATSAKTSFHLEVEGFTTRSTMLEETDNFQNRFSYGAVFSLLARRSVSTHFSLETGIGIQYTQLRQRSMTLVFGCDLSPDLGPDGERTYVDAEVGIPSLTMPLAAIFHLNGTPDGLYLKPGLNLSLNFSAKSSGRLHECGQGNGVGFPVEEVSIPRFSLLPGLAVGFQFEGDDDRTSFLELGLSTSTGKFIQGEGETPIGDFLKSAGVVMGSISMGWQISGRKKDRRPKKQQPALVPEYSTF